MNGAGRITWRQIRVGLAVLVVLVILGLAVFFIGETGAVFGERYQLVTLMPNANGLIEGASVRLAGQDVGKVERIEFIPIAERDRPDQVLKITLAIDMAVQEQIRQDSEARTRTQGLLGDKIIDVTPGNLNVPLLEPGDTLPSALAIDYEQILGSASQLVDDLGLMIQSLRTMADSLLAGYGTAGRLLTDTLLYVELTRTSRSLTEFLDAVGRGEGALAQLAQDERLYNDLRSVVAGMDTLTERMTDGDGTLARLLTDDALYERMVSSSARADSLLAAIEAGEGTLGQMITDQQLYENMVKLLVDIQSVVTELRQDPQRYIPPIKIF